MEVLARTHGSDRAASNSSRNADPASSPRPRRRTPLLIALIALVVFLPGFWWGAPHATSPDRTRAWGVDDETPLGPLAEIANIVRPSPDRNLGYPLGYAFIVAAAYAPYLTYLKATGQLGGVSSQYPFGLSDPVSALRTLSLIAHMVTVLMAIGVILAVYDAARTTWNEQQARIAVAFTLAISPLWYYARTGNVDVPTLFFIAWSIALLARAVRHGLSTNLALLIGATVGFGLGTKESALGSFLAIPIVLLWQRKNSGHALTWKPVLAGVIASILALGLSSGLFVDPDRYFAHLSFLSGRIDTAATGEVIPFTYPNTWAGHAAFSAQMVRHLAALLTWPGLALAAIGMAWTLYRDRRSAFLILPTVTYLAFMFVMARTAQLRYMLPAAIGMAFFAARTVELSWQANRPLLRIPVVIAAAFALGLGALQGVDLTYQMIRDSRFAAGSWLDHRADGGARIEYFGASQKVPPLPAEIISERATTYLGMFRQPPADSVKAKEILQIWEVRRPDFVLVMPDHTSKKSVPHDNTLPPQLYQALIAGTTPYRLAAYFKRKPLFPFIPPVALDYPVVNPPIRIFARH